MDYLVTMTTQVPSGVADSAVAAVRAREAAHTAELARAGRVLRLWRPPLRPREWRTLGLFTADNAEELEQTLAGMPLRVWRTDTVTPLLPHSNDPGAGRVTRDPQCAEFLTTFAVDIPAGTPSAAVDDITAREALRAHELAVAGHLLRLWVVSAQGSNLGLWQARDADEMAQVVRSLPMLQWLTVDTVPLTAHPNDPATATTVKSSTS